MTKIRTPLTAIISSLSLVRDGMCDDPIEQQESIEQAYWSALCLLGMINDATLSNDLTDRPPSADGNSSGGSVPRPPLPFTPITGAEAKPDTGISETP